MDYYFNYSIPIYWVKAFTYFIFSESDLTYFLLIMLNLHYHVNFQLNLLKIVINGNV